MDNAPLAREGKGVHLMARSLIIDDVARAKAARVLAHAEANPYLPGDPVPGDQPGFVAHFGSYRSVFTYTHTHWLIFRHLTVSVPTPGKYPNPIAVFEIANLFGFTGHDGISDTPPVDWRWDVKPDENCIVVLQAMTVRKAMQ
jgi:hypothetical protein